MPTPTLVLFDIDGTLIHTARAGLRGMNTAFRELHDATDALDGIPIAGRTDVAIAHDAFNRIGVVPTAETVARLRDRYCHYLAVELQLPSDQPRVVLPGVIELLNELDRSAHVTVALLTGNFIRGAAIKLGHFKLWDRFRFGAFGDVHADRRDLVPVAIEKARQSGVVVSPRRVIVIGDTPLDVDCAHAHGARAVGVATGPFSAEELRAAGADLVVDTLTPLCADTRWLDLG